VQSTFQVEAKGAHGMPGGNRTYNSGHSRFSNDSPGQNDIGLRIAKGSFTSSSSAAYMVGVAGILTHLSLTPRQICLP